jgi:lyso-ornithine lipid O-acyltransferase
MSLTLESARRLTNFAIAILRARWESRLLSDLPSRTVWQQRLSQRMLAALNVETSLQGDFPRSGLVVCNHLGYLDALVIASLGPAVFVAKSDARKWPFFGKILECAGTILAERERPLSAGKTALEISNVLKQGLPVVLFPEGTSSDGTAVLPFKPTLFQAALEAKEPITPAAIFYQAAGGDPASDVCYWGDATLLPHLIRLAGLKRVVATIHFGSVGDVPAQRKAAASQFHGECSRLLDGLKAVPAS